MVSPSTALSISRVLAASGTVLVTTLDDCVWLVPFVAKPLLLSGGGGGSDEAEENGGYGTSNTIGMLHAVIFVATLTSMAVIVCAATEFVVTQWDIPERSLAGIGAIFCWILAAFLCIRKMIKRRRRKRQREQQQQFQHEAADTENVPLLLVSTITEEDKRSEEDGSSSAMTFQPCVVASLTILGSLDEISYFPPLILGQIFSPAELILGTFLAAICMVFVVVVALQPCNPCMECLDRIPLYAVVSVFAIVLTVEWVLS